MNAISTPANGLMIYNTSESRFYYYDGNEWRSVGSDDNTTHTLDAVAGTDSLTAHRMIVGDTAANFATYHDYISQQKKFTNTTGLNSTLLETVRTEKYGMNYAPYGKVGSWNRYIARNWYNFNGRPGEIMTLESYNMNGGGGALIPGEGAWSHVLESEWNRQFEDYVQIELSNGYSYRPFAMYISKDTALNDITFRGSIFHVNPASVAQDYLNVKNGKMVLSKVAGAPSEVSNTLFSMLNGTREINLINNTQSLVFSGAVSYAFDNSINPIYTHTANLGSNTSRWKGVYTDALVIAYVTVPDANYVVQDTDHTINFKNITANRTLTINGAATGRRIVLISGQASHTVNFSGTVVKNSDGTTASALPPGKSCVLNFDGTNWWVVSVSSNL